MKKIVAFPFRSQKALMHPESRQMLLDAGFEIIANETGAALPADQQKEMIKDAYAIVAGTEKYDAAMLEGCDNLKAVIRFGVGTDNFDLKTMKEKGIEVGVIANHDSVAEFAMMLLLSAMKNAPRLDKDVREGKWARYPQKELTGKTVGIIGFGRIGRRLAEMLQGFKVNLLAYDPYLNEEKAAALHAKAVSLDELLAQSDVVSLHLPHTPETDHMCNADFFAKMKDGAYFVNTSRGKLVDEKALCAALESGKLSGAGIDVYEVEPVTPDNPLFAIGNTALAPHCAALSYETNYNGAIVCAQSIINVLEGKKSVNPLF